MKRGIKLPKPPNKNFSRLIQEQAFEAGYRWGGGGGQEYLDTGSSQALYFYDGDMTMTHGIDPGVVHSSAVEMLEYFESLKKKEASIRPGDVIVVQPYGDQEYFIIADDISGQTIIYSVGYKPSACMLCRAGSIHSIPAARYLRHARRPEVYALLGNKLPDAMEIFGYPFSVDHREVRIGCKTIPIPEFRSIVGTLYQLGIDSVGRGTHSSEPMGKFVILLLLAGNYRTP